MRAYLREGSDTLDEARGYRSKRAAIAAYRASAEELARYDQAHEASVHFASCKAQIAEYPDFVLSLGPRGGVRCERA